MNYSHYEVIVWYSDYFVPRNDEIKNKIPKKWNN